MTQSLFDLTTAERNAQRLLEQLRWSAGVVCPCCKEAHRITPRTNLAYRCNRCRKDFNARTGSVFQHSHVPIHQWLATLELLRTCAEAESSTWLAGRLNVTQKTAWRMLDRLRSIRPLAWYKTQNDTESILRVLLSS